MKTDRDKYWSQDKDIIEHEAMLARRRMIEYSVAHDLYLGIQFDNYKYVNVETSPSIKHDCYVTSGDIVRVDFDGVPYEGVVLDYTTTDSDFNTDRVCCVKLRDADGDEHWESLALLTLVSKYDGDKNAEPADTDRYCPISGSRCHDGCVFEDENFFCMIVETFTNLSNILSGFDCLEIGDVDGKTLITKNIRDLVTTRYLQSLNREKR